MISNDVTSSHYLALSYEDAPIIGNLLYSLHLLCHAFRVIDSKNKDFGVGDLVTGTFGWCTHAISDGKIKLDEMMYVRKIDPSILLRASTALGILGMPG